MVNIGDTVYMLSEGYSDLKESAIPVKITAIDKYQGETIYDGITQDGHWCGWSESAFGHFVFENSPKKIK